MAMTSTLAKVTENALAYLVDDSTGTGGALAPITAAAMLADLAAEGIISGALFDILSIVYNPNGQQLQQRALLGDASNGGFATQNLNATRHCDVQLTPVTINDMEVDANINGANGELNVRSSGSGIPGVQLLTIRANHSINV